MRGGTGWCDIYRAYDDASLALLTNTGLLRRAVKDAESGRVAWLESNAENGVIAVDGQRVRLDSKGIKLASCDCPAPGICRHILAAVLWMRELPAVPDARDAETATDGPAPGNGPDAMADLLSLEQASVFKQAGKAAVRQAVALSRQAPQLAVSGQGSVLVITMPDPGYEIRYVAGAGFEGMISEIPSAKRNTIHLLAVILIWQSHGKELDLPADIEAEASTPETALATAELQFLHQVRKLLYDLVCNGLSHVSNVTATHLQALNMSARREGVPRLAALLRNLGGTIDLLAQRDIRADEQQALHLIATINAFCAAMTKPGADLALLRGGRRTDFELRQETELLSLGGHWWENRSGARGLTLLFWDPIRRELVRVTQARPDGSDPSFRSQSLWSLRPVWPGGGSAEQLSQGTIRLSHARISEDNQLAAGDGARVLSDNPWRAADPRFEEVGEKDWLALTRGLRKTVGLTSYQAEYLLLRPTSVKPPVINEVSQSLEWIIVDGNGQDLLLRLEYSAAMAKRIANLEMLVSRRADIRLVVVRVNGGQGHHGLVFEPLAVLLAESGLLRPVSLDFAKEVPKKMSPLMSRITRMLAGKRASAPAVLQPSLAARVLSPVLNILEMLADTGRQELTEIQREVLKRQQSQATAVGLELPASLIGNLLAATAVTPARLLRLYFLIRRCLELDGIPVVIRGGGA